MRAVTQQDVSLALIVLVEDEPAIREALARYLRTLGHDVPTAANGVEALKLLDQGRVDAVITDIRMPEMDGLEFVRALRKRQGDLPVIAISGGGMIPNELLLESAGLLGAVATLQKPFKLEQLRQAIDAALRPRGAGD